MKRSSLIASLLSLLVPGLGQVYAGAPGRGVSLFLSMLAIAGLTAWRQNQGGLSLGELLREWVTRPGQHWFALVSVLGLALMWLWAILDAGALVRNHKGLSRVWPFAIAIALIYGYGAIVTQINLYDLTHPRSNFIRVLRQLSDPDLIQRDQVIQRAEAPIQVPCAQPVFTPPPPPAQGPYLKLSQYCAQQGDELTVEGFNFPPNTEGFLHWTPPGGSQQAVAVTQSDQDGHFRVSFRIPDVRSAAEPHTVDAELSVAVGPPRPSEALKTVIERMVETIFLALMATTFAVPVAAGLSFFGARNLMTRTLPGTVVYYLMRTIFNLTRAIEPLILGIIFVVWVSIGPFAGVLALSIHSIAALAKLYSEQVESIDPGPIEAILATGANQLQTVMYGVVPQIIPPYIAFTIERWDINVRMSTIIGFVGGGGIGFILQQWIGLLEYRSAAVAVLAIALVVAVMDYISAKVRERVV